MNIRINNNQKRFRIYRNQIKQLCTAVLTGENQPDNCELGLSVVSDNRIALLNKQYLDHDGPTDVISFPQDDDPDSEPYLLGDVVVSADRALDRSQEFSTSLDEEFGLYIIHGILHLLGYDDQNPADKPVMENRQQFWLRSLVTDSKITLLSNNQTQ